MAKQLQATVYSIEGMPQKTAFQMSFPTDKIFIKGVTSDIAAVNAEIVFYPNPSNPLFKQSFLVSETYSALVALANTSGTSQVEATVLNINGNPPSISTYSFPASEISIWPNIDGSVNALIIYKGQKYYVSETESDLVAAANAGGGGGGTPIESVTYAELVTKITGSTLTVGQQYLISDYATKHYIVDTNGTQYLDSIITGTTEGLIITAVAANKIASGAKSILYPQDVIYYDWNPDNWLDDLSFSDVTTDSLNPTIVTGFKGVITFRFDTYLDNWCGYDFREVKFRRWKPSVSEWDNSTEYVEGQYVTIGTTIYASIGSNTNQNPTTATEYWASVIDLTKAEYIINNPNAQTYLLADPAQFADFKTFSEGANSATYALGVRSTHFGSFRDTNSYDDATGTLLSNNVIFLQDTDYYSSIANDIASENFGNTIIGDYFGENTIATDFGNNIIGKTFTSNKVGHSFLSNIVGENFLANTLGGGTMNIIGVDFQKNSIGANMSNNKIGNSFQNNDMGSQLLNSNISAGFQKNRTEPASIAAGINFVGATHVYAAYNTTIFLRQDGAAKLSYYDNSNIQQVVNANA